MLHSTRISAFVTAAFTILCYVVYCVVKAVEALSSNVPSLAGSPGRKAVPGESPPETGVDGQVELTLVLAVTHFAAKIIRTSMYTTYTTVLSD